MISAVPPKPTPAVVEILDFARKHRLTLDDLIQIGGQDFRSASAKMREKARRVEQCWGLMARRAVKFADLEQAPPLPTTKPARRRRGEGHFSEVIENTSVSDTFAHQVESNEINDLVDSAPVGGPDSNSEVTP